MQQYYQPSIQFLSCLLNLCIKLPFQWVRRSCTRGSAASRCCWFVEKTSSSGWRQTSVFLSYLTLAGTPSMLKVKDVNQMLVVVCVPWQISQLPPFLRPSSAYALGRRGRSAQDDSRHDPCGVQLGHHALCPPRVRLGTGAAWGPSAPPAVREVTAPNRQAA